MSSFPGLVGHTALDMARTQWYHITVIVLAGVGFFTQAYELFCIVTVSKLLGRASNTTIRHNTTSPASSPRDVMNLVVGVALVGTPMHQLILGDKLGRKCTYGIGPIMTATCVISFGPWRDLLWAFFASSAFGFGIGGEYPLSAVIMSELGCEDARRLHCSCPHHGGRRHHLRRPRLHDPLRRLPPLLPGPQCQRRPHQDDPQKEAGSRGASC